MNRNSGRSRWRRAAALTGLLLALATTAPALVLAQDPPAVRAASRFHPDASFTADSLLRTAAGHVKNGQWAEAIGLYQRVIREFADQKEAAADARARLGALTKVAAPSASPARRLVVDWMERYLRGESSGGYEPLAPDGRHLLRYNQERRAFEETEIGTNSVRQLTSDGPHPAEALLGPGGELPDADRGGVRHRRGDQPTVR